MDDWHEETDDPLYADERNFYKVEQWHVGGEKHIRLLYAGNNLERARKVFTRQVKRRPTIKVTLRQRARIIRQWPEMDRPMTDVANIAKLPDLGWK